MSITVNPSSTRRAVALLGQLFSPRRSASAGAEIVAALWRHRALARELIRRDLAGQYANQALGSFWVIGHPLSLLLIYIFVFVVVLKVKIPADPTMTRDYTSYILAGLVPWLAIAQSLGRTSMSLMSQANLVKQVVFPIEVLPPAGVVVALIPMVVGVAAIIAYELVVLGSVPITILLAPVFMAELFLFLTGLAFLLSAVTPFFRDTKDFVTVSMTVGVYLIPAFYLPAWVPHIFRPLLGLNPFSYPIWVSQDIFYFGRFAHPRAWLVLLLMTTMSFVFGYRVFRRIRPFVSSVL
jgi:lipopolysaccharide transport system permease protein